LGEEEVGQYLETMKQQFESPEVSQHYPEEEEADSDKDDNKKFDNKKEQIQGFCL